MSIYIFFFEIINSDEKNTAIKQLSDFLTVNNLTFFSISVLDFDMIMVLTPYVPSALNISIEKLVYLTLVKIGPLFRAENHF